MYANKVNDGQNDGGFNVERENLAFVNRKYDEIVEYWLLCMKNEKEINIPIETVGLYEKTNIDFIRIILDYTYRNKEELNEHIQRMANQYIRLGWPLSYFIRGLQLFRHVLLELLLEEKKQQEKEIDVKTLLVEIEKWINPIIVNLVNEYAGSWESQVSSQQLALKELSAPVIPVFDKISVMPLIGTIDEERAQLMMENLLEGVMTYRSEVVLIDVTGVPVIDTMVAHHIIHVSQAVRLVGAKCILVGIRPEIAQTITNLGIDLSEVQTKGTLEKGIQLALTIQKKKIIEVE